MSNNDCEEPPKVINKNKNYWIDTQREFDKLKDIDEIFAYLRNLVDVLKICTSTECKVFHEIHTLDLMRMDFEFVSINSNDEKDEVKNLTQAREKITNQTYIKTFFELYKKYIKESKSVFSKIFAMKVSREAKISDEEIYHDRNMEIIRELNRSNFAIPIDVGKNVASMLQYNSKMGETSEDLKIHQEEQEKKARELRKKKKSED